MQLIRSVKIDGFRSFETGSLPEMGHLTALVGRNSSGKSNVLRALNLFFNGQPEPASLLTFARDHYETEPRIKRKKVIQVTVCFELPKNFKLRAEFQRLAEFGSTFSVRRRWELDERRNVVEDLSLLDDIGDKVPDTEALARQFLSLVFFRYIPNRRVPADLLAQEGKAIADAIFIRMKGSEHANALLASLSAAADRMLEPAANSLRVAQSPLTSPSVGIGDSVAEMMTMGGFRATGPHGLPVADVDWGAGHQAFFLYLILQALDTNYGRFFGWRQATIWGMEEPESALHKDLEAELASHLRRWAWDQTAKIQIIQTTHSPTFTMAADAGYLVEVKGSASEITLLPVADLTRAAEQRGISHWVHPVLSFPWNPVVLVEGASDVEALTHAAKVLGEARFRFLSLPKLDHRERGGGKDAVISYIRRNSGIIANRPSDAPFLVLLDWETSDQDLAKAREAYGEQGDRFVLRTDARFADPLLSEDFRGVERFYPAIVFSEAHAAGELILGTAPGRPYSISATQLKRAKGALLSRVLKINDPIVLESFHGVIGALNQAIRPSTPLQLSLFPEPDPPRS